MKEYVMSQNEYILLNRDDDYNWKQYEKELDLLTCKGHVFEYRYHFGDTGRLTLYEQCIECGKKNKTKGAIKHDLIPNLRDKIAFGEINKYDAELADEVGFVFEKYNKYLQIKREQNIEKENFSKKILHQNHINSDKWKAMRLKVLKRDDYTCRGCLENPATEVHHITYANLGDEFMFELMSLCRECHSRFHKKDKP